MFHDYDFQYITDCGDKVIISVQYEYSSPDPYCVDSDWDYRGGFFLDVVSVTKDGKPYEHEISAEEIERELFARLRDEAIVETMYDNVGF